MIELPLFSSKDERIIFELPATLSDVQSWQSHIPFAFWIAQTLRPRVLVELGTHKGDSYFAFCKALRANGDGSKSFAVDSWEGDEQAGLYSGSIYDGVKSFNEKNYAEFSTLLKMRFDQALLKFADGSIDLLHIDGLHTYEAVREDFETWLPKLSSNGVILFHDCGVRDAGFGVFKLWDEIKDAYPHFLFEHGHGLGVLGAGSEQSPRMQAFFGMSKDEGDYTRSLFSSLGDRIQLHSSLQSFERGQNRIQQALAKIGPGADFNHILGDVPDHPEFPRLIKAFALNLLNENLALRAPGPILSLRKQIKSRIKDILKV